MLLRPEREGRDGRREAQIETKYKVHVGKEYKQSQNKQEQASYMYVWYRPWTLLCDGMIVMEFRHEDGLPRAPPVALVVLHQLLPYFGLIERGGRDGAWSWTGEGEGG